MSDMKRLSLALVALGLSMPVFAGSSVLVPSQHGGFKAGIDALYLRPTNSDLNYATTISFPSNFTAGFERNESVDPSYDWGFYAQIGYLFPCTGNDITLGYTYLRSDDTDSTGGMSPGRISILPLSAIFTLDDPELPPAIFDSAAGKARFDLNVVDLEGGQRFTTGAYDMRMFAGLRYANINHEFQAFGSTPTTFGSQEFKSQVRGFGPRIGVDSRYCFGSGFGFNADLSTSLLVSQVDARYSATYQSEGATPVSFASRDGSNQRIVPVLEAKLGLDYTYIINCRCKSALTFEVGYQATNYFNALDHSRVNSTDGLDIAQQNATNDIAFDGIYFGVKYYA